MLPQALDSICAVAHGSGGGTKMLLAQTEHIVAQWKFKLHHYQRLRQLAVKKLTTVTR